MRIRVIVLVLVIGALASSAATAGVYLGWKSYSDFCAYESSKSSGALSIGLDYRMGLLQIVKLGLGLEYTWGDVDYDCIDCGDASFDHVGARAEAIVPIWKPSITEVYLGGGLSYNWLSGPTIDDCDMDDNRAGVHGLAGVKVSPPVLPVWFLLEGRYEWLGQDPQITVGGVYLGVGFGL